jgi:hypothetical protein
MNNALRQVGAYQRPKVGIPPGAHCGPVRGGCRHLADGLLRVRLLLPHRLSGALMAVSPAQAA